MNLGTKISNNPDSKYDIIDLKINKVFHFFRCLSLDKEHIKGNV
jgi:hypothetical protein